MLAINKVIDACTNIKKKNEGLKPKENQPPRQSLLRNRPTSIDEILLIKKQEMQKKS